MPQITNHNIRELMQTLDESQFTASCFRITFPNEGKTLFKAEFLDNNNFFFAFERNLQRDSDYNFVSVFRPGSILSTEREEMDSLYDCQNHLRNWTGYIKKELIASNPLYDEFKAFRDSINEQINKHFKDLNGYFEKEEVNSLKASLDALSKNLEELHKKNEIAEKEMVAIRSELVNLKGSLEEFPKKVWYRTAANKIGNLMSRVIMSKTGQKMLEEGTKQLIEKINS